MRRRGLDLNALRAERWRQGRTAQTTVTDLVSSSGELVLTRRELLTLAGMAAVALPPLEKTARPTLLGPVEYVVGPRRVAFRLRGRDRWVIDLRRFAGKPRLSVQQAENYLRLEVTGGHYPGTNLSANMVCELRRRLSGWVMSLQTAAGGFRGTVPLESWLAGLKPCRGRVRLKGEGCQLGSNRRLVLSGEAEAEFYPDWRLEIKGNRIAHLTGLGEVLESDAVTLCLLEAGSPSVLKDPPSKRTAVIIKREGHEWHLNGDLPCPQHCKILAYEDAFDEIRLEVGEGSDGRARGALLACSAAGGGKLRCLFGGESSGNGTFEVGLRNPRFAVAVEAVGEQAALVSDFDEEAGWLHAEGYSLQLGGTPDCPPFEVVACDGQVRRMRCEPALLKMSVPLPDAVTEPTPVAPGTRIALVTAGTRLAQAQRPGAQPAPQRPATRQPARTQAQPTQPTVPAQGAAPAAPAAPAQPPAGAVLVRPGGATVLRMPNPTVTVIRPEDLLCLTFEFVNLEIKGQPPQLQRVNADVPAYIIVHFQPQHIAEEAILEDAPEFGQMQKENIPPPPVRARMAGRSRLAFRLPEGMNQVPLTLAALLDWTKFELSVVPLALPPPEPAKLVVPARAIRGYKPPVPASIPKQPVLEGPPPELQEAPRSAPQAPAPRMPALPEDDDTPTNRAEIRFIAAVQPPAPAATPTSPAAQQPGAAAPVQPAPAGKFVYMSIREPLNQETAIEAPYRLIVSPHAGVGWVHATGKVEHGGRTELWHTRMGVRTADGKIYDRQYEYVIKDGKLVVNAVSPAGDIMERLRTMRCVWSPDYAWPLPKAPDMPTPFRMSLDQRDRAELVALTCGYGRMADWQSRVVETNTLMLSALGAWMDVRYGANLPKEDLPFSIEEWRHRMAMGRDQYVSVVYAGYLFPFGHRACLVKVTERKFYRSGQGNVAYLFQRYFLRVREPVKYYPAFGQANNARRMPLRMVRILTLVTPTLRAPEQCKVLQNQPCSARAGFWPTVGNEPFRFRMVGEDWDGQQVEFEVPVIFVGVENVEGSKDRIVAFDEEVMRLFVDEYNKTTAGMLARRTAPVPGQRMAFAESTPEKPGDTTLQVEELIFGAELDDPNSRKTQKELRANNQPRFYPNVAAAKVRIPAVEQLTGKSTPTTIRIHDYYVNHGWSSNPNPSQVFAELWDIAKGKAASLPLRFSADQSGGVATPNMDIQGLSKQFGPISDLANMLAGNFDPTKFFPDVGQLFGAVKLKDILEAIFGPDQVPAITTNIEKDEYGVPKAIVAKLTWQPKMKPWPAGKPIFATRSGTKMKIEAVMRTELSLSGPGQTSARVEGRLEKFDLNLVPVGGYDYFIQLQFDSISFTSGTGQKTDVKCDFSNMQFGGPLEFVSTLQKLIPLNGFGDGPYLDVGLDGIKAGFDLELPDVSMGMFSLSNMRLSAGLTLPFFEGSLRFRFAFCDKESPFNLAVSMFGGGGFFALELSPKQVELIEAAFEFGGSIALDIGVASGGVYAMAGIYFRWETDGVLLEGYLRMGGHLSVLGLVTLSLEFYMSLTYEKSGGKTSVRGRAELTVEIEILFFSMSVTMSVERQFAGSSSGSAYLDGTRFAMLSTDARFAQGGGGASGGSQRIQFADQMTAADWAAYCKAFD